MIVPTDRQLSEADVAVVDQMPSSRTVVAPKERSHGTWLQAQPGPVSCADPRRKVVPDAHQPGGRGRSGRTTLMTTADAPVPLRQRLAAASRTVRSKPSRQNVRLGIPQVDTTLDGEPIDPRQLVLHPGPLDFVVSEEAGGPLRAFSRFEPFADHMTSLVDGSPQSRADARTVPQPALSNGVYGYLNLFRDANYGGTRWTFQADWGPINDFRRVFCVLWWCQDINDRISSAQLEVSSLTQPAAWVVLCSDINLGGNRMWLSSVHAEHTDAPGYYPDLGMYGWSDVASSMFYVPA
jgi:hypothetical protein